MEKEKKYSVEEFLSMPPIGSSECDDMNEVLHEKYEQELDAMFEHHIVNRMFNKKENGNG